MQEELRRSNSIGDSKGILSFASVILKNVKIKRDSAQQLCSFINDVRINFNSAVAFFEYLGFLNTSTNMLIPTEEGKKLYLLLDEGGFEEALCETCLNKIIVNEIINTTALRFNVVKGKYIIQRHGFPLPAAVFRNVLIQLNALSELPDGSNTLELNERYESIFAKAKKKTQSKLSLDMLKRQFEQQENQGKDAEEYVVKYEKARLLNNRALVDKVKRISDMDVSAGYDVVSFETDTSLEYDRFIEVKSFVGQPHFYWSKNEIEVAKIYVDKYYLYLINVERITDDEYIPTIIRNPVKTVFESDDWLKKPTSYYVLPVEAN